MSSFEDEPRTTSTHHERAPRAATRRCFCACPYGPRVLWPLFFIWAATTCTYYSAFECTFFKVTGLFKHGLSVTYGLWTTEEYKDNKVIRQNVTLFFGLWDVGTANSCTMWSTHPELDVSDIDSALSFARVVSLIACIIGTIVWCWINLATCRMHSDRSIRIACCGMLATAVFGALSFWALNSSFCAGKDCTVDFSGWIGVAAIILWLISICMALKFLKDPNLEPKKRRPLLRRRFRRPRRKNRSTPKEVEEEEVPLEDGPSYRDHDDDHYDDPVEEEEPDMEGAMVPYSGPRDANRDFSIDDDEDEPIVDPYDQDPYVNAPAYDGDDREPQPYSNAAAAVPPADAFNDPRVFGSSDPDFVPSDKVYGTDDPNALPGDRVYAGDDPFATPVDKVYGSDDPNAVPGDRVFAGDDPFAVPTEKVYGSDDPNAVPGDRVYGVDDPFAVENPFAEPTERAVPDPNQGSMVPVGASPAFQAAPPMASTQATSSQPAPPVIVNPFDVHSTAPGPVLAPQSRSPPADETVAASVAPSQAQSASQPQQPEIPAGSTAAAAKSVTPQQAATESAPKSRKASAASKPTSDSKAASKKAAAAAAASLVVPGPHARAVDEDLSDISGEGDDDDDDDDEEILQSTSTALYGAGTGKNRPGPELASVPVIPASSLRPSSRASHASERPSSRASQRSQQSETRSVGQWELQF